MIIKTLWRGLTTAFNWFFPQQKALQEANDQTLNKLNKVHTFQQMNSAHDRRMMENDDRNIVKQFRYSKMGGSSPSDPANQDSIVCDNMTIDNSKGGIMDILIGGALVFAILKFGFGYGNTPEPPCEAQDAQYQVQFYDKDMNPITVPRVPQPTP